MKFQFLHGACMVLPLFSAVSAAQDSDSDKSSTWLDEVTVTAQKREQGLSELPLSITAFTGDQLNDLRVLNVKDLAENTPGLVVTSNGEGDNPIYSIRGVGFEDDWALSSGTVSVNIDEVPFSYAILTQGQVYDIERVEVLRGPQGDLYGQNTTGGTVNFVSRKPTDVFDAEVTLGYGRYSTFRTEGFVSGPLGETLRARIAWQTHNRNEGWQHDWFTGDELGKTNISNGRLLVDWTPTDKLAVLFNVHSYRDDSDNTGPVTRDAGFSVGSPNTPVGGFLPPPVPGLESLPSDSPYRYDERDTRWATASDLATSEASHRAWLEAAFGPGAGDWLGEYSFDQKPVRDNKGSGGSIRVEYDFGNVLLTSITAMEKMDRLTTNSGDGSAYTDWSFQLTSSVEQLSQEFRLTSQTDSRLSWILGAYFSDDKISENYDNDYPDWTFDGIGLPFFFTTRYTQETNSAAIFGHAEFAFTDSLTLITGLRYTNEERKIYNAGVFSDSNYNIDGAGIPGLEWLLPGAYITGNWVGIPSVVEDANRSFDQSKPSWKIGLDWAATDSIRFYGTVSEGWKSGGYNGGNLVITDAIGPYRPEILTSYELGIKTSLPDANLRLTAAVFYYDYADKQVGTVQYNPLITTGEGVGNMEEVEVKGGEVELAWAPTENLTIIAGLSNTNGEIKKFEQWDTGAAEDLLYNQGIGCDANGQNPVVGGQFLCFVIDDRAGDKLSTPEWQFNTLVQYQRPLTASLIGSASVNYTFQDDFDTLDTSNGSYPIQARSLTRVNLALLDVDGSWEVRAWADNIFDERYYLAAGGGNNLSSTTWPLPPQWGIDFTMNFGN